MRIFSRDEGGQSLIIVVFAMTLLLAMAAFTIDVASWYQQHHQAQVAADAGALAAANCLANAGSGNTCTSTTDTTDATTVATTIAKDNGPAIAADVKFNGKNVSVTTTNPAPSVFGNVADIRGGTATASADAAWVPPTSTSCSNPGSLCDFMFADDSSCSTNPNAGINFSTSGTSTVSGIIQSNGNISGSTSGNPSFGTATYGTGTCSDSLTYSGHDPWTTPPTQAASDPGYPLDYTKDFPACNGTGELACASNGYPTFCTEAAANFTNLAPANGDENIYCASGTGTTTNPSTWNGQISIDPSGNSTVYDTFVAGTINFSPSGNHTFSSCGYAVTGYASANCPAGVPSPATPNYPLFYATDTSSTALVVSVSGNETLNGDMFVPNGTASLSMSGSKTLVTFIEAKDISASISGNFEGDGPQGGGGGSTTPGSDSLTQ